MSLYSLLLLFAVFSCNKSQNQDITFDVGFNSQPKFTGTFQDSKGTEFVYFAEPVSRKCIKVFSTTGQYLYTIPLKEAIGFLQHIGGIQIVSKDTIVINSEYTNQLCAINSEGTILKKIFLNDIVPDKINQYEFGTSYMNYPVSIQKSLFFAADWSSNLNDEKAGKVPQESDKYHEYRAQQQLYKPYLLRITNILDKPTAEFGADSFYYKINNTDKFTYPELPFFTHANDKLFLITPYDKNIFVVDENTLKIENKIPIHSAHTNIGIKPIPIDSFDILGNEATLNYKFQTIGSNTRVFFNEKQNLYYVIVLHSTNHKMTTRDRTEARGFSIITLDSTFKQIAERNFANTDYFGVYIFPIKNGLLIDKKAKPNEKQITFTLFKYL
ncbi:DUF4221 family protein [Flexibacter flexilis]|nr:DUF4221 family protein [Flexibacter flexilis]